ncbi:uncharacterized protein YdeI (YjbR/CyaY-like superfamily) [Motilibacter rhizosphaerae]|uniref:Uncharacterized protein YdeI (YjbR/CyaY-like superfamily) n=1 Tax=Motilibacter rhizosphaerae TaxID=598652 RepID=A0A4Q7NRY2_9ACTN|nr:YdeI/OmpD-associated family protein [Motilibacter rhizosphaerae]RZS89856.1 uncharacterized protein YdeI (YjbR/CyaY-like superfamily) [Motilibacter rhizosphaerae]
MATELPRLLVPDAAAWRAWLAEHGTESPGVWLVLGKKGGTVTELVYEAAVREALCYGWIDGQLSPVDEACYTIRFTPRKPRSPWSAKNVQRVAELEAEGRMTGAGRAAVEAAQADGRWDKAYAGSASAEVPADLAAAIAAVPAAQAMFDVLTRTNRFALIYRTQEAKRPDTRARRIAQFVEMLARGEAPYPQRQRPAGS